MTRKLRVIKKGFLMLIKNVILPAALKPDVNVALPWWPER
jgi:hypothetical protein